MVQGQDLDYSPPPPIIIPYSLWFVNCYPLRHMIKLLTNGIRVCYTRGWGRKPRENRPFYPICHIPCPVKNVQTTRVFLAVFRSPPPPLQLYTTFYRLSTPFCRLLPPPHPRNFTILLMLCQPLDIDNIRVGIDKRVRVCYTILVGEGKVPPRERPLSTPFVNPLPRLLFYHTFYRLSTPHIRDHPSLYHIL